MEFWDRIRTLLKIMRGRGLQHYELAEDLQAALVARAALEHRTPEEVQDRLLLLGLNRLQASEQLEQRWEKLSAREREVTALTCLNYTNRQIAARTGLSVDTIKTYLAKAQVKFNLHSKRELKLLLEDWDFSEWGAPAEE
jgi:DNA-binding CsgD family transcriptional regulator